MSATFVPFEPHSFEPHSFEPHSDAAPSAIPATGSDSKVHTVPLRSPDRPIRFPHIPSIDQTPPGMALYLQRQHQTLRVDTPHPTPGQSPSPAPASQVQLPLPRPAPSQTPAVQSRLGQMTKTWTAGVAAPPDLGIAPPSTPQSTVPSAPPSSQPLGAATQPPTAEIAAQGGSARPIPVRPSTLSRESWRSLSTQVEQIAEYLRRRRNELETEQTDLKLNALMQEAALLQEREQLRGQQLNIQMVQATLEILRRQLLEFGNSLSESLPADHQLLHQFEAVCQAYYDAAGVARLLDVN